MFDSNIHTRKKEFHIYNTDDISLEPIGMCSYTFSSISTYLSRQTDSELNKYFGQAEGGFGNGLTEVKEKLTGMGGAENFQEEPSILRFNKETKQYDFASGANIFKTLEGTSVANSIEELLEKHDKVQYGALDDKDVKEVVKNIQTSISGCITFRPKFTVLGCPREPQIRLYLKDRFNNNTNRVIAQKGSPFVVDIGTRTTGQSYSPRADSPPGVYQNQSEGGVNNPNNTIAAPVDLRYNQSLGKWQGGTHQILVRLLTDIDAAPFNLFDFNSLNTADTSFYDPNSSNYISQFSTGQGLPLSVERGNPHQFGPNIIGCVDSEGNLSNAKLEKILVVNRSPRSFKKGDVVVCSHIDNEWIPIGFDIPTITKPKPKIGKWQFQKFIAFHSNFFKGYTRSNQELATNPNLIESKTRIRFYLDMMKTNSQYTLTAQHLDSSLNDLDRIGKLNIYITDQSETDEELFTKDIDNWETKAIVSQLPQYDNFYPYPCAQMTIFDQLSSTMGGTNVYGTVIGRTVPDAISNDPGLGFPLQYSLPTFWGPAFPDGYNSNQITNLRNTGFTRFANPKTNPQGLPWIIADSNGNESLDTFEINKQYLDGQNINIFDLTNKLLDKKLGMFSDGDNDLRNANQLPAEVALNGCLQASTYGYPIEHIAVPEKVNSIDFYTKHLIGFNDSESINRYARYHYLLHVDSTSTNNKTDLSYKDISLTPLQPNRIQFSPLQLEFATSSLDTTSQRYDELTPQIGAFKSLYETPQDRDSFLGNKFIERNKTVSSSSKIGSTVDRTYTVDLDSAVKTYLPFHTLREFFYENTTTPSLLRDPVGSPFNKIESSNVIGIVASKNKFAATSDGSLTLTTSQYFGVGKRVSVAGGQVGALTLIGGFIAAQSPSNAIRQNGVPQWGDADRTDNYNSTGTTALHVRIFDQWPDAQTIYLGHCFSVLHFNPMPTPVPIGTYIRYRKNGVKQILKDKDEKTERWVDDIETSVDFRVPTDIGYNYIAKGTTYSYTTKAAYEAGIKTIAPISEWNINPIRRYALLTKGGFVYYRRVIGILLNSDSGLTGDDTNVFDGGSGYKKGDIISGSNNVTFEVTSVGENDTISTIMVKNKGNGFLPSNFRELKDKNNKTVYAIRMSISGGSGSGAKIDISRLVVYDKIYRDEPPKEIAPITRLTLPSKLGEKVVEGSLQTNISLTGGTGKYDAFYFFHNDILHSQTFASVTTHGFNQFVNLEISVV